MSLPVLKIERVLAPYACEFLIAHSVLVGLTPLIPIPLLDDSVRDFFLRRMISGLASREQVMLGPREIAALAEGSGTGCLGGCVWGTVEYLLKAILRKAVLLLEWFRAIRLVTNTYYRGYLLQYAFQTGVYTGGVKQAPLLRKAVDQTLLGIRSNLVMQIVRSWFQQGRSNILATADFLADQARRAFVPKKGRGGWFGKGSRAKSGGENLSPGLADAVELESAKEDSTLRTLISQLQVNFGALPPEHLRGIEAMFDANWKAMQAG